jgi:hypothetical protein
MSHCHYKCEMWCGIRLKVQHIQSYTNLGLHKMDNKVPEVAVCWLLHIERLNLMSFSTCSFM